MKISEAMFIIAGEPEGYMVSFDHKDGGMLRGDYFPDKHSGEQLISSKDEAWGLALQFASRAAGKYVNIRVVDANHVPIDSRVINDRYKEHK